MKLREYLDKERGRLATLAKTIGVYPSDISRWVSKKRPIPEKYGWLIEEATGGEVTRMELFPESAERIWPDLSTKRNRRANDKSRLNKPR